MIWMIIRRCIEFTAKFRLYGIDDKNLDSQAQREIPLIKKRLEEDFYRVSPEGISYRIVTEDEENREIFKPEQNSKNHRKNRRHY